MGKLAIRVVMPPVGIEVTGDGTNPSEEEMAEEQAARDKFVETIGPWAEGLLARGSHRMGNVSRVDLLGANEWSQLNRYLLLLEVDIGEPPLELETLLPGAEVTHVGSFAPLETWNKAVSSSPSA